MARISVNFDSTIDYGDPSAITPGKSNLPPGIQVGEPLSGIEETSDRFIRIDSDSLLTQHTTAATIAKHHAKGDYLEDFTEARSAGRRERIWISPQHHANCSIGPPYPFDSLQTIDVALGIRLYKGERPLTKEDLAQGEWSTGPDASVMWMFTDALEAIHMIRFDPALGYALKEYTVVGRSGRRRLHLVCSDFKRVGDAMFPFHVDRENIGENADGSDRVAIRITLAVKDYDLVLAGKDAPLLATFPAGAVVYDERSKFQLPASKEPRAWSDDQIKEAIATANDHPNVHH